VFLDSLLKALGKRGSDAEAEPFDEQIRIVVKLGSGRII
jgi:hypothetical protein